VAAPSWTADHLLLPLVVRLVWWCPAELGHVGQHSISQIWRLLHLQVLLLIQYGCCTGCCFPPAVAAVLEPEDHLLLLLLVDVWLVSLGLAVSRAGRLWAVIQRSLKQHCHVLSVMMTQQGCCSGCCSRPAVAAPLQSEKHLLLLLLLLLVTVWVVSSRLLLLRAERLWALDQSCLK
jgi:hypothetical protein